GSSKRSTFAWLNIILESMQRTFSPPDKTLAFFNASSPEKSIRPKNPRKNVSVSSSGAYCLSQSTSVKSTPSKNSELSFGKYDWDVVIPHLYVPESGSISPIKICSKVVLAISS